MEVGLGKRQGRMVTMRELGQDTSGVMNALIEDGEAACVTRYGRPVALIVPIESDRVESYLLSAVLDTLEKRNLPVELDPLDVASSTEAAREADVDLDEARSVAHAIETDG